MTALTPIREFIQIRDITLLPGSGSDNIVASAATVLLQCNLPIETDVVSTAMIEIVGTGALAEAFAICAGGLAPGPNTKKYHCEISFSGSSAGPFDYCFIVEKIDRGVTVVVSGRSLDGGYADNAVARLTLNHVQLQDALNAGAGSIVPFPDTTLPGGFQEIFANLPLPNQKGLYQTEPNPVDGVNAPDGHSYYRMPVVVAPALANLLVDGDTKDNFIDAAAKEFLGVSVGVSISSAPLGSYSHIVADTSDASLNLTGQSKGIGVGFLGVDDHLTFRRRPSPTDTTSALIIEPDEGLILSTDLSAPVAKIKPSGGYSNHGLPVGASITDGLCIPPPDPTTAGYTTNWYDSLFVFTASDASGLGGLYFWAHNGLAYRIGQELDFASCVAYDKVTNKIYVGCRGGVFSIACTPASGFAAKLDREGSLNTQNGLPGAGGVVAVRVVAAGSGTTIIAQVQGSDTADGLYLRDDSAPPGYSYDGYYAFDTGGGSILGFHYDGAGDALWLVYGDSPAEVSTTTNARSSSPSTITTPIPGGAHCVGIDPLGGAGAAIRTEAGADGLYRISTGIDSLNPAGTLIDRYGASVQVNRVQFAGAGLYVQGTGGILFEPALLVASTDAGPYFCSSLTGNQWKAAPKQSGIGAESVQGTAVGAPQTLINRQTTRVYCWTSGGLWISHSAAFWFDEELQQKTDLGPFMTALYRLITGNPRDFLPNDMTVIGIGTTTGTPPAPDASGTSGKAIYVTPAIIAANNLQELPETSLYVRPLDEHNRWAPIFIDTASASPTGKVANADFADIQSDNATPAATASGKLAQATAKKYMDTAIVPHSIVWNTILAFQEMLIRTLRPTHRFATDYDTTGAGYTVNLSTTKFYCLKIRFYKGRGDSVLQVEVTSSTVMRSMPPSDQQISDGFGATVSKMIRQGRQS